MSANLNQPIEDFDPSGVGLDNGNFGGLPFDAETAGIILYAVPWDVTVSYHAGTAQGPTQILAASTQVDLYDLDHPDGWRQGIYFAPPPAWIEAKNQTTRAAAQTVIEATEQGIAPTSTPELAIAIATVNDACAAVNQWLYEAAQSALANGKRVGAIGGDHSIPLGLMRALAERYPSFGILHIDAHADLRDAYQGFHYSHASIMTNALTMPQVTRLVQVGVRDCCQAEVDKINQSQGRIITHYDATLKRAEYAGKPWLEVCREIIAPLPPQVYISFDVDGLDPKLCPNTGTPVPSGLELEQVFWLLRELIASDRTIIGFDLSEVGDGEWDGNVGARIAYKLCNLMGLKSGQQSGLESRQPNHHLNPP